MTALPHYAQICICHQVSKGRIALAVREGKASVQALGECTRAGTGCGTCQPLLGQLIQAYSAAPLALAADKNKVEVVKAEKDGLDSVPDVYRLAEHNRWEEMTEADKHRFKWHGLFFRTPTPGNFM